MISVPVDAEMTGTKGRREVTNDPFSTSDEFKALCPYCALPPSNDLYDARYDP